MQKKKKKKKKYENNNKNGISRLNLINIKRYLEIIFNIPFFHIFLVVRTERAVGAFGEQVFGRVTCPTFKDERGVLFSLSVFGINNLR
jgi:hypothetical protein